MKTKLLLFSAMVLTVFALVGCEADSTLDELPDGDKTNQTDQTDEDDKSKYPFYLSDNMLTFSHNGGIRSVVVTVNQPAISWGLDNPWDYDWCTVDIHEKSVTFTVAPNNDFERIAKYEFYCNGYSVFLIIKQLASLERMLYYTSTDGQIVEPYSGEFAVEYPFGEGIEIVKNIYENGQGIILFNKEVTEIGYCAFYECGNLESIIIPASVTEIEDYAFGLCISLTSITIPDSIIEIGDGAFANCSNLSAFYGKYASEDNRCLIVDGVFNSFAIGCGLTSYTIPDGVTEIGVYAFYGCNSLESVTIPGSVTEIGGYSFCECSSLTSITIPDGIAGVGYAVFANCKSLTSVIIPNSVTEIGGYAFQNCSNLTNITIPDSVTKIGEGAISLCTNLKNITIPDSVTEIGSWAFWSCDNLETAIIGNRVTTIGGDAFYECSRLKSVYCKAVNPPTLNQTFSVGSYKTFWPFDYNASGRKFYVPQESIKAYKAADGWSSYANDIFGYDFSNE